MDLVRDDDERPAGEAPRAHQGPLPGEQVVVLRRREVLVVGYGGHVDAHDRAVRRHAAPRAPPQVPVGAVDAPEQGAAHALDRVRGVGVAADELAELAVHVGKAGPPGSGGVVLPEGHVVRDSGGVVGVLAGDPHEGLEVLVALQVEGLAQEGDEEGEVAREHHGPHRLLVGRPYLLVGDVADLLLGLGRRSDVARLERVDQHPRARVDALDHAAELARLEPVLAVDVVDYDVAVVQGAEVGDYLAHDRRLALARLRDDAHVGGRALRGLGEDVQGNLRPVVVDAEGDALRVAQAGVAVEEPTGDRHGGHRVVVPLLEDRVVEHERARRPEHVELVGEVRGHVDGLLVHVLAHGLVQVPELVVPLRPLLYVEVALEDPRVRAHDHVDRVRGLLGLVLLAPAVDGGLLDAGSRPRVVVQGSGELAAQDVARAPAQDEGRHDRRVEGHEPFGPPEREPVGPAGHDRHPDEVVVDHQVVPVVHEEPWRDRGDRRLVLLGAGLPLCLPREPLPCHSGLPFRRCGHYHLREDRPVPRGASLDPGVDEVVDLVLPEADGALADLLGERLLEVGDGVLDLPVPDGPELEPDEGVDDDLVARDRRLLERRPQAVEQEVERPLVRLGLGAVPERAHRLLLLADALVALGEVRLGVDGGGHDPDADGVRREAGEDLGVARRVLGLLVVVLERQVVAGVGQKGDR